MSPDAIFSVVNTAVLPFWVLLAVAPRWLWTQRLVHSVAIPGLYGLAYLAVLVSAPAAPEGASMSSLGGVLALFGQPEAALAGWIHYLVFDLFVGAWIARDAARRGIHHAILVPCLAFTLMLGPIGLMLYCGVRAALRRVFTLVEWPARAVDVHTG